MLPNEICQLPNLKVLNAGYNQLTELPEEIGDLSNLQELHLHFNGETHTHSVCRIAWMSLRTGDAATLTSLT